MKWNKYTLIGVIIIISVICVSCTVKNELPVEDTMTSNVQEDGENGFFIEYSIPFSYQRVEEDLTEFTAEKVVGRRVSFGAVDTAEQAAKCAEQIWFEIYGKEQIIQQRPYIVQFDEDEGAWQVTGNCKYLDGGPGGVAYAYIAKDGNLLNVVHSE